MAAQAKNQQNTGTLKGDNVPSQTENRPTEPEEELFSWRAPARPFKRRDRQFWITIVTIAGLCGLILFLIEGVMPVILLISLMFLFYVLSTVEPEKIGYSLTNLGVKVADNTTDYVGIRRFWFTRRFNDDLVVFETSALPGRLELVIDAKDAEKIRKILSKYLSEEEVSPSNLDRITGWVSTKLPQ